MACHCHDKEGRVVNGHVRPTDQCTACARKHLTVAHALYTEFTYEEDNRNTMTAQIRLAMWHLMKDHRDVALKLRDLAVSIEENRDAGFTTEWQDALDAVNALYYEDHPDAAERLQALSHPGDVPEIP